MARSRTPPFVRSQGVLTALAGRPLLQNDALPKIAVTVDLLTTGIDVPSITSLVFVHRVNSRILYEQMLGRATRKCDEIGKELSASLTRLSLYPHLENLTDMKPVVVDPSVSFEQLLQELTTLTDDGHRAAIRDQLAVKLNRELHRLADDARQHFRTVAGETPEQTLDRIRNGTPADLAEWFKNRPALDQSWIGVLTARGFPCRFPITPTSSSASPVVMARHGARGFLIIPASFRSQ